MQGDLMKHALEFVTTCPTKLIHITNESNESHGCMELVER
jgi:hypothetical protein